MFKVIVLFALLFVAVYTIPAPTQLQVGNAPLKTQVSVVDESENDNIALEVFDTAEDRHMRPYIGGFVNGIGEGKVYSRPHHRNGMDSSSSDSSSSSYERLG